MSLIKTSSGGRFQSALMMMWVCGLLMCAMMRSSLDAAEAARTFRIMTVASYVAGLKYEPGAGKKAVALSINAQLFTTYAIPAGNDLVLFKEIPPPPDAPPHTPPTRQIVAEAKLPLVTPRVLVVLMPDGPERFRMVMIDDDPAAHPAGRVRLINFSNLKAAVRFNHAQHELAPGDSVLDDWTKGGVLVQVAAMKNGQWKIAFRKERLIHANTRGYGFIFDYVADPSMDEDSNNPPPATVRFFADYVPPPKSASSN